MEVVLLATTCIFCGSGMHRLFPHLRSYVQHLPDEDSEHGKSLTRLCTYPYWPSYSLPLLVKRLVDRVIRSYLAVTLEGKLRV